MSPLESLEIPHQSHPSYPSAPAPYQQPQKPKGCCGCSGCSGCFLGCLILAFLPFAVGIIFYLGIGWGDHIDKALISSYFSVSGQVVATLKTTHVIGPEGEQTVQVVNHYLQSYLNEPAENRRLIRKEFVVALYADMAGKELRPEQIPNLNLFFQKYAPNRIAPPAQPANP